MDKHPGWTSADENDWTCADGDCQGRKDLVGFQEGET